MIRLSTTERRWPTPWLAAFVVVALLLPAAGGAQEDQREAVSLPPELRQPFLDEMRAHLGNLDDIVAALADGDFDAAAEVAEVHMEFGHRLWAAMTERGASEEEIARAKERFRQAGRGPGQGAGMGRSGMGRSGMGQGGMGQGGMGQGAGRGPGFGRFMPEGFRAIGMEFHEAARRFAEAARAADDPPGAEDYQQVLGELWSVTAMCRGCHESYRLE